MKLEIVLTRKQYHNFDIMLYPDCHEYHYPNGIGANAYNLLLFIEKCSGCAEFAWILHDKDIDEEGNLKKLHYHLFLRFDSYHRIQELSNRYGIPTNNFGLYYQTDKHGNPLKDSVLDDDGKPTFKYAEPNRILRLRYLTHNDDKDSDKVQYNPSEIHTNIQNFQWRTDIDPHMEEDALIDYCSTHSIAESLAYARAHDMRAEFYRYRSLIADLRRENEAVVTRAREIEARTLSDTMKLIDFNVKKSAREAVNAIAKQPSEFYDSDGNLLGIGF